MILVFFVAALSGASVAQTPVFRGGVDTVEVTVTVTDGQGRLITGLTKDDFTIYEEEQLQEITAFTDERVPVSLGVLLDISDSMVGQPIVDARRALDRFMSDLLEPEDEAFATTFNHGVTVVAPWTQPPSSLRGLLDAVRATGSTAIYDALAAAAPLIAARRNARAALILISDGADTASDLTLIRARDLLQRSDPFVYAIAIDSSKYPRASQPRESRGAARDHQAERRLHRGREELGGSGAGHRAHRLRAQSSVHARLQLKPYARWQLARGSVCGCATRITSPAPGVAISPYLRRPSATSFFVLRPQAVSSAGCHREAH